MNPFEEAARDAGRALGDIGASEDGALVAEVAEALAELGAAAPPRRRRRKSARASNRARPSNEEPPRPGGGG